MTIQKQLSRRCQFRMLPNGYTFPSSFSGYTLCIHLPSARFLLLPPHKWKDGCLQRCVQGPINGVTGAADLLLFGIVQRNFSLSVWLIQFIWNWKTVVNQLADEVTITCDLHSSLKLVRKGTRVVHGVEHGRRGDFKQKPLFPVSTLLLFCWFDSFAVILCRWRCHHAWNTKQKTSGQATNHERGERILK